MPSLTAPVNPLYLTRPDTEVGTTTPQGPILNIPDYIAFSMGTYRPTSAFFTDRATRTKGNRIRCYRGSGRITTMLGGDSWPIVGPDPGPVFPGDGTGRYSGDGGFSAGPIDTWPGGGGDSPSPAPTDGNG